MNENKNIFIVDDHLLMTEGLTSIIEDISLEKNAYKVCGTATGEEEALNLVKEKKPDIILIDISLSDGNGFSLAKNIQELKNPPLMIFISMYLKADYIVDAFKTNAKAFISKDSASDSIKGALEAVSKGHYFLDPAALKVVIERLSEIPLHSFQTAGEPWHYLTKREKEIFKYLTQGFAIREISAQLKTTAKTVSNQKLTIMKKLKLKNDNQIYKYGEKIGLIKKQPVL